MSPFYYWAWSLEDINESHSAVGGRPREELLHRMVSVGVSRLSNHFPM